MVLKALLRHARARLETTGIDTPDLDARLLVEHFTGTTRRDAIVEPQKPVGPEQMAAVEAALARRIAGEPVHRILGYREFYGLRLALSPGTLEPRPDTETLVDAVLPFLRDTVARTGGCRILDLGTGTGAIALALLSQVKAAHATAVDMSDDSLNTAVANAASLGLTDRFHPLKSDWFEKIIGRYDAILSNPPYITSDHMPGLPRDVRDYDPPLALDGGEDGLSAYRAIAFGAGKHLASDGIIAVEIGYDQRQDVTAIFAESGYAVEEFFRDLGGNDRAIAFNKRK